MKVSHYNHDLDMHVISEVATTEDELPGTGGLRIDDVDELFYWPGISDEKLCRKTSKKEIKLEENVCGFNKLTEEEQKSMLLLQIKKGSSL